jgi:hypothetical protein
MIKWRIKLLNNKYIIKILLCLDGIHRVFTKNPQRFGDWILSPKRCGFLVKTRR